MKGKTGLLMLLLLGSLLFLGVSSIPQVHAVIARVQGNARGTANNTDTITATFVSAPSQYNTIVLIMSLLTSWSVSSIVETGVTWDRSPILSNNASGWILGIWMGIVGSAAGTSITVTLSGVLQNYEGCVIDACEYFGNLTLDKTATDSGATQTHGHTGITATTINPGEVWIGFVSGSSSLPPVQSNPTENFTLLDGASYDRKTSYKMSLGYLEKIVDYMDNANSTITFAVSTNWKGGIATFYQIPPFQFTVYWGNGVSILRMNNSAISNASTYLVVPNTTKTFEMLIQANYAFMNWSYESGNLSSSNPFSLLIDENQTIWCLIDPVGPGVGDLTEPGDLALLIVLGLICVPVGIILLAVVFRRRH